MRSIITKKNSTKPERILAENLKRSHIPFRHRLKIKGYEVDFLIGDRIVVEIGNHKGNPIKNSAIISAGYDILTYSNDEASSCIGQIIKLWQIQAERQQM